MKTLIVVMAHREAQETFDRHLPLWKAHGFPIVVYCPTNSLIDPRGHLLWAFGQASHHGTHSNERFIKLLFQLTTTSYDRFIVFEYDAFCLDPEGVDIVNCDPSSLVAGNVFRDDSPNRTFKGTTFIHPPLLFSIDSLKRLLAVNEPAESEQFWDRWLGYVCELAGITPYGFLAKGRGYSRNTIELSDYTQCAEAVRNGAYMIHGIKTPEVLNLIKSNYVKRTTFNQ